MRVRTRWIGPAIVLALLLLAKCATPPSHAPPATGKPVPHESIRVGAWNVEWLGLPERRSGPAENQPRTPENLAEYILAANVDVLGLEEVRIDTDDGSDTNTLLRAALKIVEQQRGGHWQHRLFPTRYGRDQCCGIAWDAGKVTLVDGPRIVTDPGTRSSQGKTLWSRPPRGVLFSAGQGLTDFVVIVVHMKADYEGDFARQRAEEAQHLVDDLPSAFVDPDVLIIGDTNCGTHTEPAVTTLTAAGFVDLNEHDMPTHWRYGALDRAFVPARQPEFARRYFEVLRDSFLAAHHQTMDLFKVNYSDHFMVLTEIDVLPDDD
jgi:predicted extracellular nuclease